MAHDTTGDPDDPLAELRAASEMTPDQITAAAKERQEGTAKVVADRGGAAGGVNTAKWEDELSLRRVRPNPPESGDLPRSKP